MRSATLCAKAWLPIDIGIFGLRSRADETASAHARDPWRVSKRPMTNRATCRVQRPSAAMSCRWEGVMTEVMTPRSWALREADLSATWLWRTDHASVRTLADMGANEKLRARYQLKRRRNGEPTRCGRVNAAGAENIRQFAELAPTIRGNVSALSSRCEHPS